MAENNTPKYRLYQNTGFMVSTAWRVRRSVIFLVMLLGSAAGCTAGSCLAGRLSDGLGQTVYYDTSFGNSGRALTAAAASQDPAEEVSGSPYPAAFQNMLLVLAAGSMIAGAGIALNLRQEPMKMFGSRKE